MKRKTEEISDRVWYNKLVTYFRDQVPVNVQRLSAQWYRRFREHELQNTDVVVPSVHDLMKIYRRESNNDGNSARQKKAWELARQATTTLTSKPVVPEVILPPPVATTEELLHRVLKAQFPAWNLQFRVLQVSKLYEVENRFQIPSGNEDFEILEGNTLVFDKNEQLVFGVVVNHPAFGDGLSIINTLKKFLTSHPVIHKKSVSTKGKMFGCFWRRSLEWELTRHKNICETQKH